MVARGRGRERCSGEGQEGGFTEEHGETFGGDGYVCYPDCSDMGVYVCQNLSNCTL